MSLGFLLSANKAVWYPILFDTPSNILRSVLTYVTVALALGYIVAFVLLNDKPGWDRLKKPLFAGAICYVAAISVTFLVLNFIEDGIVPILFYPILALMLLVAASGVLLVFRNIRGTRIAALSMVAAGAVAVLVCIGVHFASGKAAEMNWIKNDDVQTLALYLFAAGAVCLIALAAFLFGKKEQKGFSTRSLTFGAVSVAMSFALSYLRIVKMPQGGSITVASLLPLMVYAYMFGVKKGMFAGMVYGLMQAIQDAYVLHPAQFILDYPAAFACIGLAGMFASLGRFQKLPQLQFGLGALIAGVLRFLMHFISGVFAFGAFAPEGTSVAVYSLTYNCFYVFPDLGICIAVGLMLFSSRAFVKTLRARGETRLPV